MEIDLGEARRYFGRMTDEMHAAGVRALQSAALRGQQVIVSEIVPSRTPQPVDRGLYRAGWRVDFEHDGATIRNDEPHAPFIEFGVRATNVKIGRRMIAALAEWAERKGIASGRDAVDVAWRIAKKAQKRGFFNGFRSKPGLGILEELVKIKLPGIVRDEMRREISRVVR